jgi:hypothetical protein
VNYQLVLQWVSPDIPTFDELIAFEDSVIVLLGETGEVDGHDVGSAEANIFLETDDPRECWSILSHALRSEAMIASVSVGYRRHDEEQFVPLWPESLLSFSVT